MSFSTEASCLLSTGAWLTLCMVIYILKGMAITFPAFLIGVGCGGSLLFLFMITAVNNLENIVFGKGFTSQLFSEVFFCLIVSCFTVGSVHRISATCCFLSSIVIIYYLNKISQQTYGNQTPASGIVSKKKRN